MRRRTFVAASAATLGLPAVEGAQPSQAFKFIPQADLAVLDPVWTTAYVTRNHGYLVFDMAAMADQEMAGRIRTGR